MTLEQLEVLRKSIIRSYRHCTPSEFSSIYGNIKRALNNGEDPCSWDLERMDNILIWASLKDPRNLIVDFKSLAQYAKSVSLFYPGSVVLVSFDYDAMSHLKQIKADILIMEFPLSLSKLSRPSMIVRDGVLLAWEIAYFGAQRYGVEDE